MKSRYNNLQNIVTYNERCHGTAPDASLRWPGDHRIYFFKNSRIHRYDEQKQVVDYVFDLKQQKDLFGNINAALTNGTKTVLFKDCYSAFTSIVPVLSSTIYLCLTNFSNGQKHEKWEKIIVLKLENTFQDLDKNKYGGFRDVLTQKYNSGNFSIF